MNKSILLAAIFLFSFQLSYSQYVTDYKRLGDKAYDSHDYYAAAVYYSKAVNAPSQKKYEILPYSASAVHSGITRSQTEYQTLLIKLADSYRLYNDFINAELYYRKGLDMNQSAVTTARFWYAVCLKSNQKYEYAITQFNRFLEAQAFTDEWSNRTKNEIASCKFALYAYKHPDQGIEVKRIEGRLNGKGSNYAVAPHGDSSLIFTSSRPVLEELAKEDPNYEKTRKKNVGDPFQSRLYESKGRTNSFPNLRPLKIKVDPNKEEGAATLSPNQEIMFLNQWTDKGDGNREAAIYWSRRTGDGWSDPVKLDESINMPGFNSIQARTSTDGKFLFFSSDRPGGRGGYDLWCAPLNDNMQPGEPFNLGPQVNSIRDERAPFYNSMKKQLTFSSNGHVGLGGMDLYRCEGVPGRWTEPVNLSYPINSAKEDVYYTEADSAGDTFYISSDRESVCCLETFYVQRKFSLISGTLRDCDTHATLDDVHVKLVSDSSQTVLYESNTSVNGSFAFKILPGTACDLLIEKAGYFSKKLNFPADSTSKADTLVSNLCMQHYELRKPIVLKNILYDFNLASLRPQSKIVLDSLFDVLAENPHMVIELSAHTDNKGTDEYNLRLSSMRAQACVSYLVSKGIDPVRLASIGYGKRIPVAPNMLPNGKDNPEGRQLNRRTEFKILKNELSKQ